MLETENTKKCWGKDSDMLERPDSFFVGWLKEQGLNSDQAHKLAFVFQNVMSLIVIVSMLFAVWEVQTWKTDLQENGCPLQCVTYNQLGNRTINLNGFDYPTNFTVLSSENEKFIN